MDWENKNVFFHDAKLTQKNSPAADTCNEGCGREEDERGRMRKKEAWIGGKDNCFCFHEACVRIDSLRKAPKKYKS
jgi:hypothetical protein